jgi:hypothetical protein
MKYPSRSERLSTGKVPTASFLTSSSFIDKLVISMFSKRIKEEIAAAIVRQIVSRLAPLNARLNQFLARKPLEMLGNKANLALQKVFVEGQKRWKSRSDKVHHACQAAAYPIQKQATERLRVAPGPAEAQRSPEGNPFKCFVQ